TPDTLREVSQNRDFTVDVVPLLSEDDHTVCSTWIRQRIAEGDMTAAAEALGRPFSVEGVVTHGAGRGGRALGFPTANLYFPDIYALPSEDRKSTRLNSSHVSISYAVFCLKKKNEVRNPK